MKEYKLKQWYPSLPNNWKHEEHIIVVGRTHSYQLHPSLDRQKLGTKGLEKEEVETSPEFWEEITLVEKDYEILSLYNKFASPSVIRSKTEINTWENGTKGNWTIHSVKRLSDGEIFTLDDTVNVPFEIHQFYDKKKYTIKSFYFDKKDNLRAIIENGCHLLLSELEHRKTPLFKTEDGVDVYEGFTVYQVSVVDKKYDVHTVSARKEITPPPSYFKYFSTKEKADDFIIREKPVLTASEIHNIIKPYIVTGKSITAYSKLYDAIKKKLR